MARRKVSYSVSPISKNINAKYEAKSKNAMVPLTQQILSDSNYFIPMRDKDLLASGIIHTAGLVGVIVWGIVYAHYQYTGNDFKFSKDVNPNATYEWFEKAKIEHLDEWIEIIRKEMTS